MQHQQDVSSLLRELSVLCSESHAAEAMQHLVEEGSRLLRVQTTSPLLPETEMTDSDRELVMAYLDKVCNLEDANGEEKEQDPASTPHSGVSQKLFNPMQWVITEIEGDAVLSRQLQNLLQLRGASIGNIGGVEQLSHKLSKADRRKSIEKLSLADLCQDLTNFLENIMQNGKILGKGSEHDLRTHLVIMKVMLCLLETDVDGGFENHFLNLPKSVFAFFSTPAILSKAQIRTILFREKEKVRLASFEATPRLLIHSGSPTKLTTLEVQGTAVGVISGLSVRAMDGEQFFEVTLKGSLAQSNGFIRIGWAVSGSDFGALTGKDLGNSLNSVVFEGFSGFLFHNAIELRDKGVFTDATASSSSSILLQIERDRNSSLAIFAQLLSLGVDKSAVLQMMLRQGFSSEEAEQFLVEKLENLTTIEEYDENVDGLASLLGLKTGLLKSSCAVETLKQAVSQGGMYLQDVDVYKWSEGTVLGCYLNSDNGDVRFYVNGKELTRVRIDVNSLFANGGVCPVFSCSQEVGLEFNIGQTPFLYPPTPKSEGVCLKLNQCARSHYFHSAGGGDSGIVLAGTFQERIKGFTLELGLRLTEDNFLSPSTHIGAHKRSLFSAVAIANAAEPQPFFTVCVDSSGAIVFETPELEAIKTQPGVICFNTWHHLCIIWPPKASSRKLSILLDGKIVHTFELSDARRTHLDNSKFKLSSMCVGGRLSGVSSQELKESKSVISSLPVCTEGPLLSAQTSEATSALLSKFEAPPTPNTSTNIESADNDSRSTVESSDDVTSFVGDFSEVRLWVGARSVDSINSSTGRAKVSGVEDNLLVLLTFEEGSGTTLHNSARSNVQFRGSTSIEVRGNWQWKHHDSGLAELSNLYGENLGPTEHSRVSLNALSGIPSHLKVHDVDEKIKSKAILAVTIHQALYGLICKFSLSADRYLETESEGAAVTWHRQIQDATPSTKSIAQPHVLNFLLLNSILKQLVRLIRFGPPSICSVNCKRMYLTASAALLRIFRVNFMDVNTRGISPAALGLQYSRNPETNHRSFVAKILVTLLYFVSYQDDAEALASCSECVTQEAVATVISGFNIFFPDASDQIFLLICLFTKKFQEDADFLEKNVSADLVEALDRHVQQDTSFPSDPFSALLDMTKSGCFVFLNAVCRYLGKFSNAAKLVPIEARPILGSVLQPSELIIKKPGTEPLHSSSIYPKLGDIVCRGPHWIYGDQDGGGSENLGIVVEIVDWCGMIGKGLRVLWSSGSINVYRWAVIEGESDVPKFDVSVLRVPGEKISVSPGNASHMAKVASDSLLPSVLSGSEEFSKIDLLYTADEVYLSLIENVGALTKRTVLAYMKETAPLAWQERNKLTWSLNTIIKEFTSESTVTLYRNFFETFSSKVPTPPARVTSKSPKLQSKEDENIHLQLEQLITMLLREVNHTSQESIEDSPALVLLLSLQALLMGGADVFGSQKKSNDLFLSAVPLRERIFVTPFSDGSSGFLSWDWSEGIWKPAEKKTDDGLQQPNLLSSSRQNKTQTQVLENIAFHFISDGLNLLDDFTVEHVGGRGWKTCHVGHGIQPESGIFRWNVKIQNFGQGKRGNVVVGICTENFNPEVFLGQDGESWGLNSAKELYHRGRMIKSDFGHRMVVSTQIEMTLDTYTGKLFIKDIRKDERREIQAAFSDLKGKVLYPAVSLYVSGDCISMFSRQGSDWKKSARDCDSTVSVSRTIPLGTPPIILVRFALQMINTASTLISSPAGVKLTPISVGLVHLFSCLCRWQYIPSQHSRALFDALNRLLVIIRDALSKSLESEEICKAEKVTGFSDSVKSSSLLKQLSCLCSCYMGRIAASMMVCHSIEAIDNRIVVAEVLNENVNLNPGFGDANVVHPLVVGNQVHTWLKSKLLSQGKKPSVVGSISWNDIQEWVNDDKIVWKWLGAHDRAHQTERFIGGSILIRTVRLITAVILYHSGFLNAALKLTQSFDDVSNLAALESFKLPAFLSKAWSGAMKLKTGIMRIKQSSSLQYPVIAQFVISRLSLIFEFEPCCQEFYFNCFASNTGSENLSNALDELVKNSFTQSKIVTEISESVRIFVTHENLFDPNSIPIFRASLRNVEEGAALRACGLKNIRSVLETLDGEFGWGSKCALLLHLPKAMRNEEKNLLVSLKHGSVFSIVPRVSIKPIVKKFYDTSGHYLDCIEGSSKIARMRIRGAFDSLYTYIANVLSSDDIDSAIQLCLIDCLGIRLLEEDHAMISRVNVFYAIHDLLTTSISGLSQSDNSNSRDFTKLTKASMKLFIILTLQVASSGETGSTKRTASASPGSVHLEAPLQLRVKSGPATLSKAVFDVLYSQLSVLTMMLRHDIDAVSEMGSDYWKMYGVSKKDRAMQLPHIEASNDALVVISEASALLLHLASHEVCQVILSRPKWIGLFLTLLDVSPVSCQKQALLLLFTLLPVTYTDDLDNAKDSVNFSLRSSGNSITEKIVTKLLNLCGRVFLTLDLEDTFVMIKGSQLLAAFCGIAVPLSAECVAILRKLLGSSSSWSALVQKVLIGNLLSPLSTRVCANSSSFCQVLASLFVLGGFVDTEYVNCPVVVDDEGSSFGVITSMNEGSDVAEVTLVPSVDSFAFNVNVKQNLQNAVEISSDKLKAVNRVLAEDVAIPKELVKATVQLCYALLFDPSTTFLGTPESSTGEEEKQEFDLQEEKSGVETESAGHRVLQKHEFFLSILRLSCSKVLVNLSTNSKSADILQSCLLENTFEESTFIRDMLTASIQCTRSSGLADIPLNESYLSLAMNQRRRALCIAKMKENSSKLLLEKSAIQTETSNISLESGQTSPLVQSLNASNSPATEKLTEELNHDRNFHETRRPSMSIGSDDDDEDDEGQIICDDRVMYETTENMGLEDRSVAETLANMGFPKRWCEIALNLTGGDTDEALAYILSNGDALEAMVSAEMRGEGSRSSTANRRRHRRYERENDEDEDIDDDDDEHFENESKLNLHLHNFLEHRSDADEHHYDGRCDKLIPLYSDHSFVSERVGSAFPGDSIKPLEQYINPSNHMEHWFKVDLRDFKDESGDNDVDCQEEPIFVWIQRYCKGLEIILPGPSPGVFSDGLAEPPAEAYSVDALYRVIGAGGAVVRTGVERASSEIIVLNSGETVRAKEETINSEGTIRLRIIEPVCGWISKLHGLLSKIHDTEPATVTEDKDLQPIVSEWTMLEFIEDDLEAFGGNDIYRRDDRFFRSLQGSHFRRCKDAVKSKQHSLHHRRLRVTGVSGQAACIQSLTSKSIDVLETLISGVIKTLTTLNCRKALLAMILRSAKVGNVDAPSSSSPTSGPTKLILLMFSQKAEEYATLKTQSSVSSSSTKEKAEDLIDRLKGKSLKAPTFPESAKIAHEISLFLRLVSFRGQPFSHTGLEWLAFSEIDSFAMMIGRISRSLDEVLFPLVSALLKMDTVGVHILHYLILSVAHGIGQAMSPTQIEQSWDDSSYEDHTDDSFLQQANMHYCQWVTALLLELRNPEVILVMFRLWSIGLRGTSMSLKRIVFDQLSDILTKYCLLSDFSTPEAQEELKGFLSHLPVERLKVMGSRRLWYELEDSPSFSRYLQRLLHLLAVIEMSSSMLPSVAPNLVPLTSSLSDIKVDDEPASENFQLTQRPEPVLHFAAPHSYVSLNPHKDIQGSWTLEMWIYRDETNFSEEYIVESAPSSPDGKKGNESVEQPPEGFSSATGSGKDYRQRQTLSREENRPELLESCRQPHPFRFNHPSPFSASPRSLQKTDTRQQDSAQDNECASKISGTMAPVSPSASIPSEPPASNSSDPSSSIAPATSLENAGILNIPLGKWSCNKCTSFNSLEVKRCLLCNEGFRPESSESVNTVTSMTDQTKIPDVCAVNSSESSTSVSDSTFINAPAFHLLSSSDWFIKLQAGGRVCGMTHDADPLQSQDPVYEKAYCMALGQRGSQDRTFDYVVPFNKWVHLAISCKSPTSSSSSAQSQLALYVDGNLRDTITMKFHLPLATIGSVRKGQSFYGSLAEMRVWSNARTGGEIKRDMLLALSENYLRHGLISHLQCREGKGIRTFDSAGFFQACKLNGAEWKSSRRPLLESPSFSPFVLGESEDSHGVLGDDQTVEQVVEMTGVLKRSALVASSVLAKSTSEVVSFFFQHNTGVDSDEQSIEGYLNWCERGVRSLLRGKHDATTGAISFALDPTAISSSGGSTILGPPEALSWMEGLAFEGILNENCIKGELYFTCLVDSPPVLRSGQSRIDKMSIPGRCIYKRSPRGPYGPSEVLTLSSDSGENRTLSTIEVVGYEINDEPPRSTNVSNWDLLKGDSAVWFEWSITKSSGKIAFGVMTADAFPSEEECMRRKVPLDLFSETKGPFVANDRSFGTSWVYIISGNILHNGQTIICDAAGDGDTVGIQVDLSKGSMSFFRNDLLLHEFTDLNDHPLVSFVGDNRMNRGLRPFFSLASAGDSVVYRGLKTGAITIQFPDNDPLGRYNLTSQLKMGWLDGKGTLRYHDKTKYMFGSWRNGFQDGVQLTIKIDPETHAETVESANVFHEGVDVCDVTESVDDLPEVTSWRATVIAKSLSRTSAAITTAPVGSGTPRETPATPTSTSSAGTGGPAPPPLPPLMSPAESKNGKNEKKPSAKSSQPSSPPPLSGRLVRRDDVTIKIRDLSNVDIHLKMNRNVKLQKAFDVYASKKGVATNSLRFLLDGELIDGDCTPESLDLAENEVIEAVSSKSKIEIAKLFESDAPFIIKIIYKEATVRNGVEIEDTQEVRRMALGEIVEGFHRAETREGIGRYLINDGWISERLRSSNEEKVTLVLRELAHVPWKYTVCNKSGARIRKEPSLDSPEVGFIPAGTEFEVVESRTLESSGQQPVGGDDRTLIKRLRIICPAEYAGWVTDKPATVSRLDKLKKLDPEFCKELARRAQVRLARRLAARDNVEKSRLAGEGIECQKRCFAVGSLDLTSDSLFLINGAQRSQGVSVSSDFKTVTASSSCQGRSMALGSRGFSRGVHYWEVQFESLTPGNIFIGVAPLDYIQSWGGYGFINYRTKISLTTDETMYGRWTKPGDTLGVLLDMDHGTLSFFLDTPEDMMSTNGLGKVRNMGVSHHYLRRMSGSKFPVLYPCFGIKHLGDQISIRKCKWVSRKGLDAPALFNQLMEAKRIIAHWRNAYSVHPGRAIEPSSPGSTIEQSCTLPKAIAETMYTGYRRSRTLLRQITSRPGVQVLLNTETEAIAKASSPELAAKFRLRALKRFKSQYGPGHIVGARGKQLWYVLESTDSEETGAWYWQRVELEELINSGFVSFENLLDGATSTDAAGTATPRSPVVPTLPMPLSEFSACAFPSVNSESLFGAVPWCLSEDVSLCEAINTFADKQGVDPMLLSSDQLETFRCRMAILPSRGRAEIHARYAALCVLNRAAELVLPLSDLGVQVGSNLLTDTEYEFEMRRRLNLPELTGPSQSLLDIKKVIFFRTKQRFWDLVLKKTTSATAEPPDEWDKPPDLREIRLNRLVARSLMSRKDSYPFTERLKRSVFGQLIEVLGGWDDSLLRRAYQHYPDAGQARAFFVKFQGEGSDDLGGPYRAVFNTVIDEECPNLLDMLQPCPNGQSNDFENRDKMVLNPRLLVSGSNVSSGSGVSGGPLSPANIYVSLGKLVGVACRHSIQVPLSLPSLIWKPLLGESVEHADLRAIDTHTSNYLQTLTKRPRSEGITVDATEPDGHNNISPEVGGGSQQFEGLDEAAVELLQGMLLNLQVSFPAMTTGIIERLLALCSSPVSASPDENWRAVGQVCELVEHLHLVAQNDCIAQFFRGLDAVLPTEIFRIFSANELELVFCGAADLDVDILKSVTVYEGVAPFDKHIQFFWESLEQLSQEERSKFVNFCSGRSRLPTSASAYTMSFKLAKPPPESVENPDRYLPKASTCFFTLNLPCYSSAKVCIEKIRYAIGNTDVMDADHLLHGVEMKGWEDV